MFVWVHCSTDTQPIKDSADTLGCYNTHMIELTLIALFAVAFTTVAWRNMDLALGTCVALLPVYLVRFHIGSLPSTMLEVMILTTFAAWTAKTFLGKDILRKKCTRIYWPWKWQTLAFVATGILAVAIAPDARAAAGLWRAYILEPLLFFIVFTNTIATKRQVKQIIFALGASTALVGLYALFQTLGFAPIPAHYEFESPPRATSVFPFPTAVGKYIGPIVGLYAGLLLARRKRNNAPASRNAGNFFFFGVITFGLIGLALSVSRGATLGVLAALVVVSLFSRWKKWLWTGLVALALVVVVVPQTRNEAQSVLFGQDVSADVHVVMWNGAMRIIADRPLLGTGLASFPLVYDQYKEPAHTEYFPNPDNLVLTLWIEMGIAGLLIFGWIIISYFVETKKLLATHRAYAVGLIAAMVVLLVHGLVDTPYFKNDLAVVFWTLAGVVISLRRV